MQQQICAMRSVAGHLSPPNPHKVTRLPFGAPNRTGLPCRPLGKSGGPGSVEPGRRVVWVELSMLAHGPCLPTCRPHRPNSFVHGVGMAGEQRVHRRPAGLGHDVPDQVMGHAEYGGGVQPAADKQADRWLAAATASGNAEEVSAYSCPMHSGWSCWDRRGNIAEAKRAVLQDRSMPWRQAQDALVERVCWLVTSSLRYSPSMPGLGLR